MKYLIPVIVALCCPMMVFCQDITGHWKGTMYNDSTSQSLEYEIVIAKEKGKLTGISHTSYVINDKKYFGIKKMNIRVAKDGKIVLQDAKMLENNYFTMENKNVLQLNVLSLATSGNEAFLDGLFVTNPSKEFRTLTGRLSVKKVDASVTHAELLKYLKQYNIEENLTVAK